jgi:Domain of unknown function (DUF6265)
MAINTRHILMLLAAALSLLSLAVSVSAQAPAGNGTETLPSAAAAAVPPGGHPASRLEDFTWLAGLWQGSWGPRTAVQAWTPPTAEVMLGSFQLSENGKTLVLELFTLTEDGDKIRLHIRHFTPSLAAWEKKDPAALDLLSADSKTAVFENPTDGEPKVVTLVRLDSDTYVSRFELAAGKGDPQITEIVYHRQANGSQPKHDKQKGKRQQSP